MRMELTVGSHESAMIIRHLNCHVGSGKVRNEDIAEAVVRRCAQLRREDVCRLLSGARAERSPSLQILLGSLLDPRDVSEK